MTPASTVAVSPLLARLWNEVRQQESLGAYALAAGVRQAITILLREADCPSPPPAAAPIDSSE